jgi:AcrR family transcriptional regulator
VQVFAEEGLDAHFERIAKEAGVGSGTLYPNFPTREILIEAAYRNEVAKLCDATPGLLATLPPRAWMGHFLDYATAKQALRAVIASGGDPYGHSRELLLEALSSLQQAGTIRSDISPADLLASLTGLSLASGTPPRREQAERLLDGLSTDRRQP